MERERRDLHLSFDKMACLKGLYLDPVSGQVEGFEDFGHLGSTSAIATHALVFMIRFVSRNLKFPFGFFFSKNTTPQTLSELIVDGIKILQSVGLVVVATVSDHGSTNVSAINLLSIEVKEGEYESL